MAKDPAFLFYSSDFLSGISDLTMEERGQYITMLCLQHQKGNLSEKTIRLNVGSVSVDVLAKFQKTPEGNFFNERLENEIQNRQNFTESRRLNGSKGGRPKANAKPNGYPNGKPKNNLSENENENTNEDEIVLKNPAQFPKIETLFILTETEIKSCIENNNRQTGQFPTEKDIGKWLATFKDINFTGEKFYENRTEIVKHFKNWVKSQKLQVNGKSYNGVGNSLIQSKHHANDVL
jgi:hypothetical protein